MEEPEQLELLVTKSYETASHEPDRTTKQWEAIQEECVGGGLDDRCSIVSASLGTGKLEVVSKRLACGCWLVASDAEEIVL